jgi:hypothetical protein
MIADVQSQELAVVTNEIPEHFVTVRDLDLMYVSGGGATGTLF